MTIFCSNHGWQDITREGKCSECVKAAERYKEAKAMIGADAEVKSREEQAIRVFLERADAFWEMRETMLEDVVAAARDHRELAAYFQKHWNHHIVDGGLSGCVIRLLEAYRTDHPEDVAPKPPADGA